MASCPVFMTLWLRAAYNPDPGSYLYARTARGRIASGDVQSRILDATESKNPVRARQLFEQLSDTEKFPDLKPEDRDRFQRRF